jgi:hypothetical protein
VDRRGLLGLPDSMVGDIDTFVDFGEFVLGHSSFELSHAAAECHGALNRKLSLQVAIQEVLKSVPVETFDDLGIDPRLDEGMLQPVSNLSGIPDVSISPHVSDTLKLSTDEGSKHWHTVAQRPRDRAGSASASDIRSLAPSYKRRWASSADHCQSWAHMQ